MTAAHGEDACVREQNAGGVEGLAGVGTAVVVVHVGGKDGAQAVARAHIVVEDVPVDVPELVLAGPKLGVAGRYHARAGDFVAAEVRDGVHHQVFLWETLFHLLQEGSKAVALIHLVAPIVIMGATGAKLVHLVTVKIKIVVDLCHAVSHIVLPCGVSRVEQVNVALPANAEQVMIVFVAVAWVLEHIPSLLHTVGLRTVLPQSAVAEIIEQRLHVVGVHGFYELAHHVFADGAVGYVSVLLIGAIGTMVAPVPVLELHHIDVAAVQEGHVAGYVLLLAGLEPGGVSVAGEARPGGADVHADGGYDVLGAVALAGIDIDEVSREVCCGRFPFPPLLAEGMLGEHGGMVAIADNGVGIVGKAGKLNPHALAGLVDGTVRPQIGCVNPHIRAHVGCRATYCIAAGGSPCAGSVNIPIAQGADACAVDVGPAAGAAGEEEVSVAGDIGGDSVKALAHAVQTGEGGGVPAVVIIEMAHSAKLAAVEGGGHGIHIDGNCPEAAVGGERVVSSLVKRRQRHGGAVLQRLIFAGAGSAAVLIPYVSRCVAVTGKAHVGCRSGLERHGETVELRAHGSHAQPLALIEGAEPTVAYEIERMGEDDCLARDVNVNIIEGACRHLELVVVGTAGITGQTVGAPQGYAVLIALGAYQPVVPVGSGGVELNLAWLNPSAPHIFLFLSVHARHGGGAGEIPAPGVTGDEQVRPCRTGHEQRSHNCNILYYRSHTLPYFTNTLDVTEPITTRYTPGCTPVTAERLMHAPLRL